MVDVNHGPTMAWPWPSPSNISTDPVAAPAQVVVFVQLVQILVSYFEYAAGGITIDRSPSWVKSPLRFVWCPVSSALPLSIGQ